MKNLKNTIQNMISSGCRKRFIAEYEHTKIRRDKLNRFITKIEAATGWDCHLHDCPTILLREQQEAMERYLYLLEVRAETEGIDLY